MKINKEIYEARAEIAKALAHKTRLEIIDILVDKGDKCVCELTEILDVSQSTVSKHLGVLKKASLVDSKKEGLNVTYSVRTPCVKGFFNCLDQILEEDLQKRTRDLENMRGNKGD
ncbi:MAG: ArsR/SmtB family transcription factor [Halanaerobiaceae bacterium]